MIPQGNSRLATLAKGWRIDWWVATSLAVVAVQLLPVRTAAFANADGISLGMAALSLLCTARTLVAGPSRGARGRGQWQAAVIGWAFWTAQWTMGTFQVGSSVSDVRIQIAAIIGRQVAFVIALVPLVRADDRPASRWLDGAMGALFAGSLTLLSWPGVTATRFVEPDTRFLYLGYFAMACLAAFSMSIQRSGDLHRLALALFSTMLSYGIVAVGLREVFADGRIGPDSPLFLLGDLAFVSYLALIARRGASEPTPDHAARNDLAPTVSALVLLFLTICNVVFAFLIAQHDLYAGVVAGLSAVILYVGRTLLIEERRHKDQQETILAEQQRSRDLTDLMHEIRSPLGAILLNAGMLTRNDPSGTSKREIADAIAAGCTGIVALLDDILMLERIEHGMVAVTAVRCDLAAVARDIAGLLRVPATHAGVRIDAPEGNCFAVVDEGSVRRIMTNLVHNSIRFTPAGGVVGIVVKTSGRRVSIVVADTGVGMDAQATALLFRRFALVGTPLHGRRGSGLGLSISQALARAMDGGIAVTSSPGAGTTMTVDLRQAAE